MTQARSTVRGAEPDDEVPPVPQRPVPRVPEHDVPELGEDELPEIAEDDVPATPATPTIGGERPVDIDAEEGSDLRGVTYRPRS